MPSIYKVTGPGRTPISSYMEVKRLNISYSPPTKARTLGENSTYWVPGDWSEPIEGGLKELEISRKGYHFCIGYNMGLFISIYAHQFGKANGIFSPKLDELEIYEIQIRKDEWIHSQDTGSCWQFRLLRKTVINEYESTRLSLAEKGHSALSLGGREYRNAWGCSANQKLLAEFHQYLGEVA